MIKNNSIAGKPKGRHLIWLCVMVLLIGIGVVKALNFETEHAMNNDHITFGAKRGPLRISVVESGTIKARDQIIIKNRVEGRTSIISLVEEGIEVKTGDLLIELDSSDLLDKKIDQQIKVQNAEAAFVGARENLAVIGNQAQSDIDKAKLTYDFALQDLKKYKEGEFPNELKQAESKIILAKEEISRAREKLGWSKKLYEEKYISKIELQSDELAEKKKMLDLEFAVNELNLLKKFTYQRKLAQLDSDVKQADMALERTNRKAKADIVQAQANLKAKEAEYGRQKDKLQKIEQQLQKTKIYAPEDGLVVYATSAKRGWRGRSVEPLQEGQEVRERQELIYLPTTGAVTAEVSIHEANVDKIRIGMPVIISVDALPGETFKGRVARIAPLPDPQSAFLNPDLKLYNTDIYLDGNHESLRTGMTCKAEIVIDQYENATYIPVQAVLRVSGKPTVYVVSNKTMEARSVEIGLDNNRMVRIISGLRPGEMVTLTPPLAAASTQPETGEIVEDKFPGTIVEKSDSAPIDHSGTEKPVRLQKQTKDESPSSQVSAKKEREINDQDRETKKIRRQQMLKRMSSDKQEKIRTMSREERKEFWRQVSKKNPGREETND